jgi:hypothetical protein
MHHASTMIRAKIVFGLIAWFFLALPAMGWDAGGHEIVAWIAQDHLNEMARAKLDALAVKVKGSDGAPFDPVSLATWMDVIKGYHPDMPFAGFFRPWHYVDFGLKPDDPQPVLQPGHDNEQAGNAVCAFQRADVVMRGGTDPYIPSQAIAAAIVLHLIGDVHQPLHATSEFYTVDQRLENDAGGNKKEIINSPVSGAKGAHVNLHYFWDSAWRASWDDSADGVKFDESYSGLVFDPKLVRDFATKIESDYPPDPGTNLEPDFIGWAKESNQVGRDIAYGHLMFGGARTHEVKVSQAYVEEAHRIACQRLVLAGLRLAQYLNETLGSATPSAPPPSWPAGPPAPEIK